MKKSNPNAEAQIFWSELVLAALIPFFVYAVFTPSNVIDSHILFKLPAQIGWFAGTALLAGVPVGILGIKTARRMKKRRIVTMILSILNLIVGLYPAALLMIVIYAVLFKGVSV